MIPPELVISLITVMVFMLFGFLLMITSSPRVAAKIAARFGLLALFAVFVWRYHPVYIEFLKTADSLPEIVILLGATFIILLVILYFVFSLLLGAAFARTIVGGIISSFIYDVLKRFLRMLLGLNRAFYGLWANFIRSWRRG